MPVNNQNPQQQKRVPVSINGYPEAVHDMMRAKYPDYDQVMGLGNQTMQGGPSGQIPAVAPQPMNMNVFQQNGGVSGKLEAPIVQTQQVQAAASPAQTPYLGDAAEKTQQPQTSFEGMQQPPTGWKADGTPSYDALSSALNGSAAQQRQVPEFQADPSQRDGGFFGWLGKLIPKSRPGMREGETPDEYDRRITTNRERIAAFADAIRHMGNIVNTSKGAPLQVFNDPTSMMEQGYQNRKAQRQKQDAIDADAAYKQANLSLKQRAAEVAEAYKKLTLGYRDSADKRAQKQFEYQVAKDAASAQRQAEQDKLKQDNWERQFKFREQQAAISNGLRQQSINKRGSGRSSGGKSGGGSGSSNGYPLYNPVTGKTEYFKNEKSWIARAAELGYDTTRGNSSSTTTDTDLKKETINRSGASVATKIGKQTAQKKAAAKAAAQKKAAPKKSAAKGSDGGKGNHNALNNWFKKNNK